MKAFWLPGGFQKNSSEPALYDVLAPSCCTWGWLMNTFIFMPSSAWLTTWVAAALAGMLWSPTLTPLSSTETDWPAMVMPDTAVPPEDDEPLPSVWAWALLITDWILTTPPKSTLCTVLVATALPTAPSTVLEELDRVLP